MLLIPASLLLHNYKYEVLFAYWHGPVPTGLSSGVYLGIYQSYYEMSGEGKPLRSFLVTIQQLWNVYSKYVSWCKYMVCVVSNDGNSNPAWIGWSLLNLRSTSLRSCVNLHCLHSVQAHCIVTSWFWIVFCGHPLGINNNIEKYWRSDLNRRLRAYEFGVRVSNCESESNSSNSTRI